MDKEKVMKLLSSDSWENVLLGWEFLMKYHYPRTEHAWHRIMNLAYKKALDSSQGRLFFELILPTLVSPNRSPNHSSIYRSWRQTWPELYRKYENR